MIPPARSLPPFRGAADLPGALPLRPAISHVVFDFDGTLSWIRHGWPAMMSAVFERHLPHRADESAADRRALMDGIIFGLNGQPTIVQMQRFAQLRHERGAPRIEAEEFRREFQDSLDTAIADRLEAVRSGVAEPDAYVVFGARALLERLHGEGKTLVILSSTIEHRVREEAEALDLARYFGPRIHGSHADPTGFSKRAVFERLLRKEGIRGEQLLAFGDGPVEIRESKQLGGVAVAICSDEEENGSGVMDAYKRQQLLEAGADAALPDFREANLLVDHLLGKGT